MLMIWHLRVIKWLTIWVVLGIMLIKLFVTPPPIYTWYKCYRKINTGHFSIHWNALLVLFYGFCLNNLYASSYSLPIFLNSHSPTCKRSIFVEAGPRHVPWDNFFYFHIIEIRHIKEEKTGKSVNNKLFQFLSFSNKIFFTKYHYLW